MRGPPLSNPCGGAGRSSSSVGRIGWTAPAQARVVDPCSCLHRYWIWANLQRWRSSTDTELNGNERSVANDPSDHATHKRGRLGAWVASAAAIVGLLTGIFTLKDQIFPDDRDNALTVVERRSERIPQFKGVAGHFDQSRAILDFLGQNDGSAVRLDVVFRVPKDDLNPNEPQSTVNSVFLYTACLELPPGEAPSGARCTGVNLVIVGDPFAGDAQSGVPHGSPVIDGYYKVRVSTVATNGFEPISLTPLSVEQAKAHAGR